MVFLRQLGSLPTGGSQTSERHYNKIKKKHSVKQVQNRDRIKIKEIISCGYVPYVIKDEIRKGNLSVKRREEYVNGKFLEFINWLNKQN